MGCGSFTTSSFSAYSHSVGRTYDTTTGRVDKASAVCFFSLPEGKVIAIDSRINEASKWHNVHSFHLKLKAGDTVNKITSSLNRYGQFIVIGDSREEVYSLADKYENQINQLIIVE